MKKLIYLCAVIFSSTIASAQLQNLDFENWESPIAFEVLAPNNPNGWRSCNRWFGTEHANFAFTFQGPVDTIAQQNNYAIQLSVWYHNAKDAAYQTSPIDYKPTALKGYYKYEGNHFIDGVKKITDTAQVLVILSKWNAVLEKEDTIGLGTFKTAQATTIYKEFNVAIQYFSSEMPEKITVLLDPSIIGRIYEENYFSAEQRCSWFTVDNLTLMNGATSLNEVKPTQNLAIYPNPTSDKINFEPISGNAIISDISGRKMMSLELKNEQSIDIQHLEAGIYFLQINKKENQVYYSKFKKR